MICKLVLPDFPSACGWGDKVWIFPFWLNHACDSACGFQLKNHEVIQTNLSVGQAVEEGTQRTGKREVSNTWTTLSESLKHTSFTLTFGTEAPIAATYLSSPPMVFHVIWFSCQTGHAQNAWEATTAKFSHGLVHNRLCAPPRLRVGSHSDSSALLHIKPKNQMENESKGKPSHLIFLRCKWSFS